MDADVIVVGAGLAGLVATHELTRRGKRVALVDQENAANLGGQAYWSFGGLFLVDSPEQRRMRIKDSFELAWSDWQGSAAFDRLDDEDVWAAKWARAYVEWAAGEKRDYLTGHGISFLPTVGWAERGDLTATGHGNSVPRFHVAWGTGTGVVGPFADSALTAAQRGLVRFHHRHRVDELVYTDGAVTGVRGTVLAPDNAKRGAPSNRDTVGDFELSAQAVVVTTGGIGANHEIVRRFWPERMGTAPKSMITGVPAHVDGRMLDIAADSGVRLVNRDRMWHYTEGIVDWDPIWPNHAIRILPGPSSMWFDALGRRLPAPYLPGYDTLGTLRYLRTTPGIAEHDHSWFILTQRIIEKEFALSGSEQNPDITAKDRRGFLKERLFSKGAPGPVEAFKRNGVDFVVADDLEELVRKMNALTDEPLLDATVIRRQIEARDLQVRNPFSKDAQIQGIHNSRRALADRIGRTTAPHRILDPAAGPLIGIKLHILTRKTLGGIQTDLASRAIGLDGAPIEGLYAAGEVAGFGGGGVHGYNALEGTFLGGCIFSGRAAGRALADRV
ncbi:FAD-binding dehydrogenase [Mycolicibacterium monacense]|uniref:FAD-binding dehydrogenase n=1 Tax=Mycolicibacterium monacense TaxID=85693 RepID=A0AAD1N234_MYCMB|nr:FAD-binding dehydrogenase [Mycolicibacterium monacense]MDA4103292.1 FAD-binding dehydrogenase [Mycolicibacterium monacense DSM 44395]OBB56821.1 FAD-binding dehydrogenase [Mycolicibacterium monacense]ORB12937.1 FAD-binding dehydrogenase [Mycolicibacterium monacense DSM 44395]QHP88888.1 FAD-binding dehydrogenase [Mycolicibacterium monacense DSM 44395]BBZ63651.1 FAD-binding dehydrogenase [Mycolicibacterium monacense]